jgi:hypothetical protein
MTCDMCGATGEALGRCAACGDCQTCGWNPSERRTADNHGECLADELDAANAAADAVCNLGDCRAYPCRLCPAR